MGVLRYTFLYVITHSNIHVLELTVELQICVPPSLQHIAVQRSALRSTMQNIMDTKDHRTDKAKRLVLNCPGVQGADYTSNTTCLSLGYTHTSIYPFHFATPKQLHNSAQLYLPGRGTKHKKTTCDSGSMRKSLEKRCEGNVCGEEQAIQNTEIDCLTLTIYKQRFSIPQGNTLQCREPAFSQGW